MDMAREQGNSSKREHRSMAREGRNGLVRFPLADESLESMFKAIETAVTEHGCDNSHLQTRRWLSENRHPVDEVVEWLRRHGGYCDCEVIMNAAEFWMRYRERGNFYGR